MTMLFDQQQVNRVALNEAIREANATGFLKGVKETARNLLRMGTLSIEQIANVTGLSKDEIAAL